MDITKQLSNILEEHNGGAFLFIGSGFSRRYLNLEDWRGLLAKFCSDVKPFKFYETSANGNLAKASTLLSEDFHEIWWELNKYQDSRSTYESELKDKTSALRVEISDYLKNINLENPFYANNEKLLEEIELFKQLNVNGIITTNWDLFLENIFPQYTKFIGQKELLFAQLHGALEIYKIHGCVSNPHSLVLTDEDYIEFEKKNSYLAAKLLTIFMEHPIIFIGYSLSDENIRNILTSLVKCLDISNLDKLRRNLIFIQRLSDNETEQVIESSLTYIVDDENIALPITLVKTNDFIKAYTAIHETHMDRFPIKLLQKIRKQIYELEFSDSPKEKISVIDAEKIDDYDKVDFVIGIGIKERLGISEHGYSGICIEDILDDTISNEETKYDPLKILTLAITGKFNKRNRYLPIFKYLRAAGINSISEYEDFKRTHNINFDILVNLTFDNLQSTLPFHKKDFERSQMDNLTTIIEKCTDINTALLHIPFLDFTKVTNLNDDLEKLRLFLDSNKQVYLEKIEDPANITAFKKVVVLYDKLKYSW